MYIFPWPHLYHHIIEQAAYAAISSIYTPDICECFLFCAKVYNMWRLSILSLTRSGVLAAGSTFLPRIFPFSIAYVLYLRNQDINPHIVVLASVTGAMIGDALLWWIGGYIVTFVHQCYQRIKKISWYRSDSTDATDTDISTTSETSDTTGKKPPLYKREIPTTPLHPRAWRSRIFRWIHKLVRNTYLILDNPRNAFALFVAIAFTAYLAIPDLVIISLVREHKNMWFYLSASFIGKFALYGGYVYALEWSVESFVW